MTNQWQVTAIASFSLSGNSKLQEAFAWGGLLFIRFASFQTKTLELTGSYFLNVIVRQRGNFKWSKRPHRFHHGVGTTRMAADQANATCGGDMRSAVRALILANEFLEWELQTQVSRGYLRGMLHGRFKTYSG